MRSAVMRLIAMSLLCLPLLDGPHAQTPGRVVQLADGAIAYRPAAAPQAAPTIVVLLHGAGQRPQEMIDRFRTDADRDGLILLAPKAQGATWDLIARARTTDMLGGSTIGAAYRYTSSRDGDRVAAAQAELVRQTPSARARLVLLGFSDGATFALALGTDRRGPMRPWWRCRPAWRWCPRDRRAIVASSSCTGGATRCCPSRSAARPSSRGCGAPG